MARDMIQQLDMVNAENPLPVGEVVTTASDRGQLMEQFKQFFYHYVAEQRGVVPK